MKNIDKTLKIKKKKRMVVATKFGFGGQLCKEKVLTLIMFVVLNDNLLVRFAIEY